MLVELEAARQELAEIEADAATATAAVVEAAAERREVAAIAERRQRLTWPLPTALARRLEDYRNSRRAAEGQAALQRERLAATRARIDDLEAAIAELDRLAPAPEMADADAA